MKKSLKRMEMDLDLQLEVILEVEGSNSDWIEVQVELDALKVKREVGDENEIGIEKKKRRGLGDCYCDSV